MSTNTDPVAANGVAPYGHTANDRPVPGGFTGTVAGFLEWLKCHLAYSRIRIGEAEPGRFGSGMIRRVELVTAGYSDDENLLGRVSKSLFATCYWESTHHGGLTVYGVPVEHLASPEIQTWLKPPTEVFQEIHRSASWSYTRHRVMSTRLSCPGEPGCPSANTIMTPSHHPEC